MKMLFALPTPWIFFFFTRLGISLFSESQHCAPMWSLASQLCGTLIPLGYQLVPCQHDPIQELGSGLSSEPCSRLSLQVLKDEGGCSGRGSGLSPRVTT
jgi:hypothetical protein